MKEPKLPEPHWVPGYFGGVPCGAFSADQMREYARQAVLLERERCAKLCEDLNVWNMDDPGESAAFAIRNY